MYIYIYSDIYLYIYVSAYVLRVYSGCSSTCPPSSWCPTCLGPARTHPPWCSHQSQLHGAPHKEAVARCVLPIVTPTLVNHSWFHDTSVRCKIVRFKVRSYVKKNIVPGAAGTGRDVVVGTVRARLLGLVIVRERVICNGESPGILGVFFRWL